MASLFVSRSRRDDVARVFLKILEDRGRALKKIVFYSWSVEGVVGSIVAGGEGACHELWESLLC